MVADPIAPGSRVARGAGALTGWTRPSGCGLPSEQHKYANMGTLRASALQRGPDDVADEGDVRDGVPAGRDRLPAGADALAEVLEFQLEGVVVPLVFLPPWRAVRVHAVERDDRGQAAREAGGEGDEDALAGAVHLQRLLEGPQLRQVHPAADGALRSEEHTSELQSPDHL